jgi:hypothetical protein
MIDERAHECLFALQCKCCERYGFHEGLENVEKPGVVVIVDIELKLLAKEEIFKKLLKGVMVEVVF